MSVCSGARGSLNTATQKSPISPLKSPISPQTSRTYLHMSVRTWSERLIKHGNTIALYLCKRALYLRKRALYIRTYACIHLCSERVVQDACSNIEGQYAAPLADSHSPPILLQRNARTPYLCKGALHIHACVCTCVRVCACVCVCVCLCVCVVCVSTPLSEGVVKNGNTRTLHLCKRALYLRTCVCMHLWSEDVMKSGNTLHTHTHVCGYLCSEKAVSNRYTEAPRLHKRALHISTCV